MMRSDKAYVTIKKRCESFFKYKFNIDDEDVVYDAMTSIILQYKKNEAEIREFDKWVFGAIHNHFRNYLRKKKQNQSYTFETLNEDTLAEQKHPETKLSNEDVLKAIKTLKPNQQEVLSLRIFSDLSYEEIAEKMNLSYSNVRVLYTRALKKISKPIKKSVTFFVLLVLFIVSEV